MILEDYNRFCGALPHTSHVVQWGGSHVWKVGSKLFTLGSLGEGGTLAVTFKVSPAGFEILKEQPGLRPAPYLASRGMTWIQRTSSKTMDDEALKDYLRESHRLMATKLTRKEKAALGLLDPN